MSILCKCNCLWHITHLKLRHEGQVTISLNLLRIHVRTKQCKALCASKNKPTSKNYSYIHLHRTSLFSRRVWAMMDLNELVWRLRELKCPQECPWDGFSEYGGCYGAGIQLHALDERKQVTTNKMVLLENVLQHSKEL